MAALPHWLRAARAAASAPKVRIAPSSSPGSAAAEFWARTEASGCTHDAAANPPVEPVEMRGPQPLPDDMDQSKHSVTISHHPAIRITVAI